MNVVPAGFRQLGKQALSVALVLGIWFAPIPAGLTREAWHLFAVFRGGDLLDYRKRISAPDGLAARRGRSCADRHRGPGQGLRWLSRIRACFWSWSRSW
jgi:hypothetical protein